MEENMIKEVQGDLLRQPVDIIAHQTNCVGVMGAGIAKQIKTQLLSKSEYGRYVQVCKEKGAALLGETQRLHAPDGRIIANCFGENIPTGTGLDTDYDALLHSIAKVRNYAKINKLSVGVPGLMGCGLAGGDWAKVRQILYALFDGPDQPDLTICYFSPQDYAKWNPTVQVYQTPAQYATA